jgi:hypothetical protein
VPEGIRDRGIPDFHVRNWRICKLKEKRPSSHLILLAAKSSPHDMEDLPMTNRLLTGLIAATFAASLAVVSPVLARGGGGFGGGGGGHGGFGGGGMHMGGMGGMGGAHFGGASFGGAHFGGGSFGGARFAGGPMAAHAAFAPRFAGSPMATRAAFGPRFAGPGFHGRPFIGRHAFFFRHHRRFAFFGAPFIFASYGYYDGCWQRRWTPWGWRWANVCGPYWY